VCDRETEGERERERGRERDRESWAPFGGRGDTDMVGVHECVVDERERAREREKESVCVFLGHVMVGGARQT